MILDELFYIIKKRIAGLPNNSYVVTLFKQGEDRILQKIGEESTEVILAAKGNSRKRIVEEMADLYFMTLILLAVKNISPIEVFEELEKRRRFN